MFGRVLLWTLLVAGVVAAVLPFNVDAFGSEVTISCGTPVRTAVGRFESSGDTYLPGTDVGPFPTAAFCRPNARERLGAGVVGVVFAAITLLTSRRRRPASTDEAAPPRHVS
jgi:hypothetical protein